MTFIVERDAEGQVRVSYTEGGASITLSSPAEHVSFTDAYAAPDAEKPALAAVEPPSPAAVEPQASGGGAAAEPDNAQPFKCPACGATYAEQGECTNQHPPEQTLPTEDVLAGAPPALEPPPAGVSSEGIPGQTTEPPSTTETTTPTEAKPAGPPPWPA